MLPWFHPIPGHPLVGDWRDPVSLWYFGRCGCGLFMRGIIRYWLIHAWQDHVMHVVAAGGRFAPLMPELGLQQSRGGASDNT